MAVRWDLRKMLGSRSRMPSLSNVKFVIVVEAQLPKMSPLMIAILSFVVSMAGEESLKVGSLISLPDSDN